jgi:hypothetical protein
MSGSPFDVENGSVEYLLKWFNDGVKTPEERLQLHQMVLGFRNSVLYNREMLALQPEDQARHEPERRRLLRTLLYIETYLESPYADYHDKVKALYLRAEDAGYRTENRDSIFSEITLLQCDMCKHMHTLSKELQEKHAPERLHLCQILGKIQKSFDEPQ